MKKYIKKTIAIILSGCLISTAQINNNIQEVISNGADTELVNNIVLFAQFTSSDDYNFMSDYTDEMISMCNDDNTVRSLAGYINTISYGKMKTECYFPQMQGDVIIPYTMSQSEDSYSNNDLVLLEVLDNVEIPDNISLDGNNDGIVDNIILVIDASEESMGNQFWPCAFNLSGAKINGLYTGTVNLLNSKRLFKDILGGAGVLCHEFLHSLGYPDLYRSSGNSGTPVGQWDIMASDSIYVQYPLAYMRSSISGWLDSTEITENGSYSLEPVSAQSGNRVYILKTPLSNTEFFVVEFRKQAEKYSNEIDEKIYGTGMVVYRVNTEVDGNHKTDKNEIYVFRPDETDIDTCGGDIFSSFYGVDGRDSIGSLDFSDGISENALVYSDGTNSGIKISNITINDDNLSFDVEFADTSSEKLWQSVNISELNSRSAVDMAVYENYIYLLTSDGTKAIISIMENGEFVQQSVLGSGDYGSVNNAHLTVLNGIPYILYNDYDYNYVLCAYNSELNIWEQILKSSDIAQYTDISNDGNKIFISYTSGTYPYKLNVVSYNPDTNQTEMIGNAIAENVCNISIDCQNNKTAVSYRDLNDSSKPKTTVWDGNEWVTYTLSEKSCSTVYTLIDANNIYISVTGDSEGLYCINDLGEITYKSFPETEGSCFTAIPLIYDNQIFVSLNTQNSDDFSLYQVNNNWVKIGNSIASEIVNSPVIKAIGNSIYSAYSTSNATTNVKKIDLQTVTTGDLNLDENINVADLLILQKYILNILTLNSSQLVQADLNSDGNINASDLIELKRIIKN